MNRWKKVSYCSFAAGLSCIVFWMHEPSSAEEIVGNGGPPSPCYREDNWQCNNGGCCPDLVDLCVCGGGLCTAKPGATVNVCEHVVHAIAAGPADGGIKNGISQAATINCGWPAVCRYTGDGTGCLSFLDCSLLSNGPAVCIDIETRAVGFACRLTGGPIPNYPPT